MEYTPIKGNRVQKLIENSTLYIVSVKKVKKRYFFDEIDLNDKLIGLIGARGVGKTTFILDYLKKTNLSVSKKLYISADSIDIANSSLIEIAKNFQARGGEILAIDEIHKYQGFEKELKQIYDMLDLKVLFSGSSAINLEHSKADLSRRASIYKIEGMSYREFLEFKTGISFKKYTLKEILQNHTDIAYTIKEKIKPIEFWEEYIKFGYYPFYFENKKRYPIRLNNTVNTTIETDLPSIFHIRYENIIKLKKLILYICTSEPFKLNIKELSAKIGIDRDTLYLYMDYLHRGKILRVLRQKSRGDGIFVKPDKVYLNNSNLNFSYCDDASIGMVRETLFAQFFPFDEINIAKKGDFIVNDYTFEIGGKNKTKKQIKEIKNSFIVADDIEIGFGNKIPLWLFGFLY